MGVGPARLGSAADAVASPTHRSRPGGLPGPVRPAAHAGAEGGGRPARGRPRRDRARLRRPPGAGRRARPRGRHRVPRADRRAARAEVAPDAAARGGGRARHASRRRPPTSCSRGCSSTRATARRAGFLRERLERRVAASATAPRRCRPSCGACRSSWRRRPTTRRCSPRRSAACCARRRRSTWPRGRARSVSVGERLRTCAACSRAAGGSPSTTPCEGADRVTEAVTLFALLELYKAGEAMGAGGSVRARSRSRWPSGDERAARASSRRCCSCPPSRCRWRRWPTRARRRRARSWRRSRGCASTTPRAAAASCCARSPAASRSPPTRSPSTPRGACSRRPRTPPLTQAQAECLAIVAYLQPVSRPEIARIRGVASESAVGDAARARADRGVRPLAVRRDPLPHHRRCSRGCSASAGSTRCPTRPASTRRPRRRASCASACCSAGEQRAPPSRGRRRAGFREQRDSLEDAGSSSPALERPRPGARSR